jgi:hypothetical protein
LCGALFWIAFAPTHVIGQLTPLEKQVGRVEENVKTKTDFGARAGSGYWGEVVLKGDDYLVLRHRSDKNTPSVDIRFYAVDVLREGGLHKSADGCDSYLWADVKVGDEIHLAALIEKGTELSYCTEICIRRRPRETLPMAQRPKNDTRYAQDRIFNDIENGDDVSDADIAKSFPASKSDSGKLIRPAGLPKVYQERLDAIRAAKQEKDLKAAPPDKK